MRVRILRVTSSRSCCNLLLQEKLELPWSARPPSPTEESRRLFSRAAYAPIAASSGSNSPETSAASSGGRSAGHPCKPAADGTPLPLPGSSLQIVRSRLILARISPPQGFAGVEDDEEETRVTLPGGGGPRHARVCPINGVGKRHRGIL